MKFNILFIAILPALLIAVFGVTAITEPNDGLWDSWDEDNPGGNNWGQEFIKLPSAWDFTTGSKDTKIGIVDLGFDIEHEDLKENIGLFTLPLPIREHGTRIAGIIGAKGNNEIGISGVMWDATMLSYSAKVPFKEKTSSAVAMLEMWLAISRGAKIINYSFGVDYKNLYWKNLENLAWEILLIDKFKDDVLFIFAAGEGNVDNKYSSPSSISTEYNNVISVANSGEYSDLFADSNYGDISVAAPGAHIFSTIPGNNYGEDSGTSFAAPFVTGLAGLIYSKAEEMGKELTPAEVKDYIIQGAINGGKYVEGPDGRKIPIINAHESLKLLIAPPVWSEPIIISPTTRAGASMPDVDVDKNNYPHVVWYDYPLAGAGFSWILYSSYDGISWVAPIKISDIYEVTPTPPVITIDSVWDSNGQLHVVWSAKIDGIDQILYAYYDGISWSNPLNISNSPKTSGWPSIGVDSMGQIHVVWEESYDEIYYTMYDGNSWSAPVNISRTPAIYSVSPIIVIDKADRPHIAWYEYITSIKAQGVYYTTKENDVWATPIKLFDTPGSGVVHPDLPTLAVDQKNHLYLAWSDNSSGNGEIYYSWYDGNSWAIPVNVSKNPGASLYPSISVDLKNQVHLVWNDNTPTNSEIYYVKFDGNTWSTPINVSNNPGSSYQPKIAIGANNKPHLVWFDFSTGKSEIYYSFKK